MRSIKPSVELLDDFPTSQCLSPLVDSGEPGWWVDFVLGQGRCSWNRVCGQSPSSGGPAKEWDRGQGLLKKQRSQILAARHAGCGLGLSA
jgi:hypothetical protein